MHALAEKGNSDFEPSSRHRRYDLKVTTFMSRAGDKLHGKRTRRQQNRSSSRSSSARTPSGMARASFSVRWLFPPLGAGAGAGAGVGDGDADGTAVMT